MTNKNIKPRRWCATLLVLAGLSALLSSCSSLPTIVPDMDTQSARTIQMKGGRGVLTEAQNHL